MNKDIYTELRLERGKELLAEVERLRLVRGLPRRRQALGRRAIGRLGGMLVAAGSRLERFEDGGKPVAFDV